MDNNNNEKERRLSTDSVEIEPDTTQNSKSNADTDTQSVSNSNNRTISGYALKFNTPSKPLGNGDNTFTEVISPKALQGVDLSNVYMLNDHDFTQVLASTKAGTLKLNTDDTGLHFEATLPNTSLANDVLENIKAGNTTDTSFGFVVDTDGDQFTTDNQGNVTRTINQVKSLFDVSICAIGAYDLGSDAVQVDTRSYEKWLTNQKRKAKQEKMESTIINPTQTREDNEVRSYEEYIRSQGTVRDISGLTTDKASAVVPKTIITPILNLKNQSTNLAQLINRKTVGSNSGSYPIGTDTNAILATKAELAEIENIDDPLLKGVDYKLQTRAGKIYLSQEAVDDSEVDIISEVKTQLEKLVTNTDNTNIAKLMTTEGNFQSATANSLDDVKKVKNTMLKPSLSLTVVTNQSGFNYLDSLKDSQGRYLLQPDVTALSGKSLFGIPVAELSDIQLPNNGGFPMFIGDLSQALFEAYKPEVLTQWQEFNAYAQGLSVVLRSDYRVIDKDSGVLITIADGSTKGAK